MFERKRGEQADGCWLNRPIPTLTKTISPAIIPTTSTPYSNDIRLAGFWTTNTYGTYVTANTTDVRRRARLLLIREWVGEAELRERVVGDVRSRAISRT